MCLHKLMPIYILLLIPLAVMSYNQSPLYSSNTPRVSYTAPSGFTAMTTASSSRQPKAFPTLLHSSSFRMCLTECRVFITAYTSNKQHTMQLQQNKHTPNTATQVWPTHSHAPFTTSSYTSDYDLHLTFNVHLF